MSWNVMNDSLERLTIKRIHICNVICNSVSLFEYIDCIGANHDEHKACIQPGITSSQIGFALFNYQRQHQFLHNHHKLMQFLLKYFASSTRKRNGSLNILKKPGSAICYISCKFKATFLNFNDLKNYLPIKYISYHHFTVWL